MTETDLRQKFVNQIIAWKGVKESNGTHRKIIDIYNSHKPLARGYKMKYTDAWCAATVSACAIATNLTPIIPTECGCEEYIKRFQAIKRWVEKDDYIPKIGDIIFYDWKDSGVGDCTGRAQHVGIVTKMTGDTMTITEGNNVYNGEHMVRDRPVKINARYIRGFATPDYASIASKSWWEDDVEWCNQKGLFNQKRGDDPCTRGELAAVCHRLYNLLEGK